MKKNLLVLLPLAFLCLGCADPNYERAYASSDFVSFFETLARFGEEGMLRSPALSFQWTDPQTGSKCKDFRCFYSNQDFSSISELAKTIEVTETSSKSLPDIEGAGTYVDATIVFGGFMDDYYCRFKTGSPLCDISVTARGSDSSSSNVHRYFDWGDAGSSILKALVSLEPRCHSADYDEGVALPF